MYQGANAVSSDAMSKTHDSRPREQGKKSDRGPSISADTRHQIMPHFTHVCRVKEGKCLR